MKYAGWAAACALALALLSGAEARALELTVSELSTGAPIKGLAVADLNGDGKSDLVVSVTRGAAPNQKRELALFMGPSYAAKPSFTVPAPKGAGVFDTADLDGDGAEEILFIGRGAIWVSHWKNAAPSEAAEWSKTGGALCFPDPGSLPHLDLVRNWGSGKTRVLLPGDGVFRFFDVAADGLKAGETLNVEMRRQINAAASSGREDDGYALNATVSVPDWELADYDADGDADLYVMGDERVAVYRQDGGRFGSEPVFSRFFAVRTAEELRLGNVGLSVLVSDLDKDGRADLVFDKFGGSLTDFTSEIRVYRCGTAGPPEQPTYTKTVKGFSGGIRLTDADADGKVDIVIPSVEVSIPTIIKVLATKKVTLTYRLYLQGGPSFFPDEAATTLDVTYYADTTHGFDISGFAPVYGHDFTGDGKPDLAVGAGRDAIRVSPGLGGGHFDDAASATADVPASDLIKAVDLNGDKKEDLVLWYGVSTREGQVRVVTSR